MSVFRYPSGLPLLLLATLGCVRYAPAPLELGLHPAAYRARRLTEPKLLAWVARWTARPEGLRWNDRQLALVALATRSDLARARVDWRTAQASERTAGERPRPGLEAGVERAVSGSEGNSPWVISLAGLVDLELGGKRGARVQRARAQAAVAEAELRLTAWRVVLDVRAAALALSSGAADLALARREVAALEGVRQLETDRYREASLTAAELARTGAEAQDARVRTSAVESQLLEARVALASALAVPAVAVDSLDLTFEPVVRCGELARVGADSLATLALSSRPEIGMALAGYAVSEASLRLEVARQYPDLELGPGFVWDQGVHRWTLALALPGLLAFRNRGAIKEAEASRTAAAARVAELQDELLGDVELAVARCRGAALQRAAADSQVTIARQSADAARAAYARGETSRLDPALAELALLRAERARVGADARLRASDHALDAALGGFPGPDQGRWPDPRDDIVDMTSPTHRAPR
ncbi:MAG TPA: TolC family protein [Gemmatimonadales bacterium]|nr:TolC family protein [Gemmatimonadales bacterium]